jgi:nucleoside-diphosphate-sugar epimerase
VFVAGATGYIGKCLIARLLQHGYMMIAPARKGSGKKIHAGPQTNPQCKGNPDSYINTTLRANKFDLSSSSRRYL